VSSLVTRQPGDKLSKFEQVKAAKDGLAVQNELEHFAQIGWEEMDKDDREMRLKWLGVFFRPVTPGRFMLRLRLPNGVIRSEQLRVLGEVIQGYGAEGSADITTRQNLQLRGIQIEDIPPIFKRMEAVGLTSIQSGMDNVRNITGSPVAGLDAEEIFDTQDLIAQVQNMITNGGKGNPEFTNLPRKFNIAIEGSRDNSVHAEINDIAFVPAFRDGNFGFNVLVGGFFSATRCEAAIPLKAWVEPNQQVVDLCRAILEVFRDHGPRANRQKSRLMWLIDEWGLEKFRQEVAAKLSWELLPAAEKDELTQEKRDHLGVHPQKQAGLNYVGLCVPVGRLHSEDLLALARLSEDYGTGEVRLTVEQNVIIPNIKSDRLDAFLAEPLVQKFSPNPTPLVRSVVSCTGAQFCGFAIVETKQRAIRIAQELEAELEIPRSVRMHWTGCPNSCGQPQVAEIGFIGTKVKGKDGKPTEGVDIYTGGKVGKEAKLGTLYRKGVDCEDLKPILRDLLIQNFGATPRSSTV
jgi:ferredoxin-nitrite reductase